MRSTIERSSKAQRDLEGIIDYFRSSSVELAQRFVVATERSFRFLADNREIGQLCNFSDPQLANMRVWQVEGFRSHLIYFRATTNGVEIMRVLHGARDLEALFGED
jgi:toxin ParE1/3/4